MRSIDRAVTISREVRMASVLAQRNVLRLVGVVAVIAGLIGIVAVIARVETAYVHEADVDLSLSQTLSIWRHLSAKPAAYHGKNPMAAMRAVAQTDKWRLTQVRLRAIQMMSVVEWCKARRDEDPSRETRMAAIWFASLRYCSTEASCMARAEGKVRPLAAAPEPSSADAIAPMPTFGGSQPAQVIPLDPSVCPILLAAQQ